MWKMCLPQALAAAFMARASRTQAREGQMLIVQGGASDEVFLILSGRVQVSVFSTNGREAVLREMGPGRLVGEMAALADQPRSACALVL